MLGLHYVPAPLELFVNVQLTCLSPCPWLSWRPSPTCSWCCQWRRWTAYAPYSNRSISSVYKIMAVSSLQSRNIKIETERKGNRVKLAYLCPPKGSRDPLHRVLGFCVVCRAERSIEIKKERQRQKSGFTSPTPGYTVLHRATLGWCNNDSQKIVIIGKN